MTLIQKIRFKIQLHKPSPDFIPSNDGFHRLWEEIDVNERLAVIENYNKYYCKDGNFLTLEKANQCFSGSRWVTIKYTWGVEPF